MASSPRSEQLLSLAEVEHRLRYAKRDGKTLMLGEAQAAALLGRSPAELNSDLELLAAAGKAHEGELFFDAEEVLKRAGDGKGPVERGEERVSLAETRDRADALEAELRGQGLWPGAA
jgi:hypothetical protein